MTARRPPPSHPGPGPGSSTLHSLAFARVARHRIAPTSALWWLVLVLFAAAVWRLGEQAAASLQILTTPPIVLVTPPVPATIDLAPGSRCNDQSDFAAVLPPEPDPRLAELEDRIRDLQVRNQLLRKYLDRQAAPTPAPATPVAQPARRAAPRAPRLRTSTPKVQLIGSDALISGTVTNGEEDDWSVRLEIELLRNARVIRTDTVDLVLPAHSTSPYAVSMPTSLGDGTYSARVTLEP